LTAEAALGIAFTPPTPLLQLIRNETNVEEVALDAIKRYR